uniref:Tyr recombinase domain-containing protein n=1 Tax=Latimeria chalumnae TaxID=7897 RepID=H2ZVW1_LATCH
MAEGLSASVISLILALRKPSTNAKYNAVFAEWQGWCSHKGAQAGTDELAAALNFSFKFESGCSTNTVQQYGSALASVVPSLSSDKSYLLLQGACLARPVVPKYSAFWDVDLLLNHSASVGVQTAPLRLLSIKLATLLTLVMVARVSELTLLHICPLWMVSEPSGLSFTLKDRTKTQVAQQGTVVRLVRDQAEPTLCGVSCVERYLEVTTPLRRETSNLLLRSCAPHSPASVDTVRNWVKAALATAGIDTSIFKPHSMRGTVSSRVSSHGFSLEAVLYNGKWS